MSIFQPKNDKKILALAIRRQVGDWIKFDVLWQMSRWITRHNGFGDIGPMDITFINDINSNPKKYVDYK